MQRQREKELVKNTGILAIGTFLPKAFTFIVTPLLTGGLTKTEYGQYDLIQTLVSLLLPAVTLQITSAAFRFLIDARENDEKKEKIITNIYLFVTVVTAITASIFYFIWGRQFSNSGLLVCLYFVSNMYLLTSQQIMRGLGKNLEYTISSILSSCVNMILLLILIGGFFFSNLGLFGVIVALLSAEMSASIYLAIRGKLYKYISFRSVSFAEIKSLIAYSWPMVPNNLSGWVLRLSDRLVITYFVSVEANAVYSVANKFPGLISALQGVLIYAWQENASLAANDTDKRLYFSKMCNEIFYLLIGFVAVIIAMTPLLWIVLIRGDYDEAYYQLPVLFIGIIFSCMASIVGGIYIAFKRTLNVGITTSLAAIINLIIDLGLVNIIGIWAGSISTLVSYLFLLVYRMINVQKFQKVDFEIKKIVLGLILLIVMVILNIPQRLVFDLINAIIAIFVITIFCGEYIKRVSKQLFSKLRKSM